MANKTFTRILGGSLCSFGAENKCDYLNLYCVLACPNGDCENLSKNKPCAMEKFLKNYSMGIFENECI